ncbi:MAG: glycosyltransferase [Janthinobacterium lividum]
MTSVPVSRCGDDPAGTAVERVLVVVPARNEQIALPACLGSLELARAEVVLPVHVVVVADSCTDDTERLARHAGVQVVVTAAGRVGVARGQGVLAGLADRGWAAGEATWIATTDADSQVPRRWLAHHVEVAADGFDLLLGTVALPGSRQRHAAWHTGYERRAPTGAPHEHVHGANLGIRASVYAAVGGFPAVAGHEDRLLSEAVRSSPGARVLASTAYPVLTSDRVNGRAPVGLAHDLRAATGRSRTTDGRAGWPPQ